LEVHQGKNNRPAAQEDSQAHWQAILISKIEIQGDLFTQSLLYSNTPQKERELACWWRHLGRHWLGRNTRSTYCDEHKYFQ
jgi:hypothetical protein